MASDQEPPAFIPWAEHEREEPLYFPITNADRPAPTGPPPPAEVIDAVWAVICRRPKTLGQPGRLYDEVRSRGIKVTRSQILMALVPGR